MATPEDFDVTYFDSLTVQQFTALDGPADAPEVQEVQEQIDRLQSEVDELGGLDDLEAALDSARKRLDDLEVQYELGEATDSDLTTAEQAVEDTRAQLQTVHRKRQAIERLRDRKAAALEAARRALLDRAVTLYEKAMRDAEEKMRETLKAVEEAESVLSAAGTDRMKPMRAVDSDVRLYKNCDSAIDFLQAQLEEGA